MTEDGSGLQGSAEFGMTGGYLEKRELNRATLSRQMLLERTTTDVPGVLSRLVGLQAQLPEPPYVGLWSRIRGFDRGDLASLIDSKAAVKVTWIRATLHLCDTEDYRALRASLQPVLSGAWATITKGREFSFELDRLLEEAGQFIAESPRTFAEVTAWAAKAFPGQDAGAVRYAIRTHLPLVQVPVEGGWTYPAKPRFALAEEWIGQPLAKEREPGEWIRRYLSVFGPASATDLQTWLGGPLKEAFEAMRPELRVYRDKRRELFDLPDLAIPEPEIPAPVRFLPAFDNLLLSHSKRDRVVADQYRSRVYLPGLRVAATFLVDGFVAGVWSADNRRGEARLGLNPFVKLSKRDSDELVGEGERLIRFLEPGAKSWSIDLRSPG